MSADLWLLAGICKIDCDVKSSIIYFYTNKASDSYTMCNAKGAKPQIINVNSAAVQFLRLLAPCFGYVANFTLIKLLYSSTELVLERQFG